jgi:hypothetical protein
MMHSSRAAAASKRRGGHANAEDDAKNGEPFHVETPGESLTETWVSA